MGRPRPRMPRLTLPAPVAKRFNNEVTLACDIMEGVVACNKDVPVRFAGDTRKAQLVSDAFEQARLPLTPFMRRVLKECPKTWPSVLYMLDVVSRRTGFAMTQATVRRSVLGALHLLLSTEDSREDLSHFLPRSVVRRCGDAFLELLHEAQAATPSCVGSPDSVPASLPSLPRSATSRPSSRMAWSCSPTALDVEPRPSRHSQTSTSLTCVTSFGSLDTTPWSDESASDDASDDDESWEQTLGMQNIGWVRAALPRIARAVAREHARTMASGNEGVLAPSPPGSPRARVAERVVHVIPDCACAGLLMSASASLSARCSSSRSERTPRAAGRLREALSFQTLSEA